MKNRSQPFDCPTAAKSIWIKRVIPYEDQAKESVPPGRRDQVPIDSPGLTYCFIGGEIADAARVSELTDVLSGHTKYRGFRIDLLSFPTAERWRPLVLVKASAGALVAEAPPIVVDLTPTKVEADELVATRARARIDKRFP